ncbi:hypothetical protein RHGRI_024361 [Rhododendron griersonianum]|uniref:TTI1 C-terminal TPR domain-containing protein n=1 Tax=Rhododendron griersonianum TaxID=479676 RepID=A0AAV6J6Y7_9ERIC|nr:hypothetical protein RHGRI_024361 [Rhododendron griersonianum]
MYDVEKKTMKGSVCSESRYVIDIDVSPMESGEEGGVCFDGVATPIEQWESILFSLNDSGRYRRTVGSIAGSCVLAATLLLTSMNQAACLISLDIVEDGILALAKVEEAFTQEWETKEAVKQVCELCSFQSLSDTLDASDDETDENRLLPAMNKIWPFLVACLRNKNPLAVRKCAGMISNVVQICGGDFFSGRFYTDGPHFWKLLSTSPFQTKPISKQERTPLQLLRSTSISSDVSVAEGFIVNSLFGMANVNFPRFVSVCDRMDCTEFRLQDATISRLRAMLENNNDAIQDADHREDAIRRQLEQLQGLFDARLDEVRDRPRNGLVQRTGNCVRALSRAFDYRGVGGNFRYRVGRSLNPVHSEAIYREARQWNIPLPVWAEKSDFTMDVVTNQAGIPIVYEQIPYGG